MDDLVESGLTEDEEAGPAVESTMLFEGVHVACPEKEGSVTADLAPEEFARGVEVAGLEEHKARAPLRKVLLWNMPPGGERDAPQTLRGEQRAPERFEGLVAIVQREEKRVNLMFIDGAQRDDIGEAGS